MLILDPEKLKILRLTPRTDSLERSLYPKTPVTAALLAAMRSVERELRETRQLLNQAISSTPFSETPPCQD